MVLAARFARVQPWHVNIAGSLRLGSNFNPCSRFSSPAAQVRGPGGGWRSLARSPTGLQRKSSVDRTCSSWSWSTIPGRGLVRTEKPTSKYPTGLSTRRLSSFLPRGRGSDSTLVYIMVGLNLHGMMVMFIDMDEGAVSPFIYRNFLVSTDTTLTQGRLHTMFTSNFSHRNLWNGAIYSYMLYTVGQTVIQHLGRRQFLALYMLGGAFSQFCHVAGPEVARRLGLPTVLQLDPCSATCGGPGPTLALLAWYCASFPGREIIFLVTPMKAGIAGALFLGGTLYQIVSNGRSVPLLARPANEIWRTLGAVTAGVLVAIASRGRGGRCL